MTVGTRQQYRHSPNLPLALPSRTKYSQAVGTNVGTVHVMYMPHARSGCTRTNVGTRLRRPHAYVSVERQCTSLHRPRGPRSLAKVSGQGLWPRSLAKVPARAARHSWQRPSNSSSTSLELMLKRKLRKRMNARSTQSRLGQSRGRSGLIAMPFPFPLALALPFPFLWLTSSVDFGMTGMMGEVHADAYVPGSTV